MSAVRQAAPMRTIHRERKSRFLRRRPTNPYFKAFSTASCAARFSLLLVRKKPDARASVLWRYALRLGPRLTLGTFHSLLYIRRYISGENVTCGAVSLGGNSVATYRQADLLSRESSDVT